MEHSGNISFFPLGVGHGVQREGKDCQELVRTIKRWQLECREKVNGVSRVGKRNARRRRKKVESLTAASCLMNFEKNL